VNFFKNAADADCGHAPAVFLQMTPELPVLKILLYEGAKIGKKHFAL